LEDGDRAAKSVDSIQGPARPTRPMSQPDPTQAIAAETYCDRSSAVSSPISARRFVRIHQERQHNG
jgi:hypothetical protein